jgi:hypothetical protein
MEPIEWKEVSEPGAVILVYSAKIPDDIQDRISAALEAGMNCNAGMTLREKVAIAALVVLTVAFVFCALKTLGLL